MTKRKNKIIAVITSAVMAASMSTAIFAASSDTCPPHNLLERYVGVKYDHSLGEHEYLFDERTDADGVTHKIYKTCQMRGIGYQYEYKCTICGYVDRKVTKSTVTHSACGQTGPTW